MIKAQVLAASSYNNRDLWTLLITYPWFIHNQFMTHRVFSRNVCSSRAIPIQRTINHVFADTVYPLHWGAKQRGMQADRECNVGVLSPRDASTKLTREQAWDSARNCAIAHAQAFDRAGYHKQIVNRLIEPFKYVTTIVTGTEWSNFFSLRLDHAAQPEIQELARCMHTAMKEFEPVELEPGQWHLPFITEEEKALHDPLQTLAPVSTARCARISYLKHDNTEPTIDENIKFAWELINAGHLSPTEHIARVLPNQLGCKVPDTGDDDWPEGVTHMDESGWLWSGNLRGWIQYRHLVT